MTASICAVRTRKNNHNKQLHALAGALREFDRLPGSEAAARRRWVASHLPLFTGQPDPLLRARFFLRAAHFGATPMAAHDLIDGLLVALRTFVVNEATVEATEALLRLAYWYLRIGHDTTALEAGRLALANHALRPADEAMLTAWMCTSLSATGQLKAAWELLEQQEHAVRSRGLRQRLPVLGDIRATLHLIEALRARRVTSIFCLDLAHGAPDLAGAALHLERCAASLQPANATDARAGVVRTLTAMLHALRGDAAGLEAKLLALLDAEPGNALTRAIRLYNAGWCYRLLGEPRRALDLFEQALGSLAYEPVSRLHTQIWLDSSVCHEALCNPARSLELLRQFIHGRARLAAQDSQSFGALTQTLAGPAQPLRSVAHRTALDDSAGAPTESPQALRTSEPAILAQAERLYMSHLPRRLAMDMLASAVGVSVRTLQMAARRHRACTLGDMLRQRLLTHARELLQHSDLPISSIAQQLGYPHAASFTRDVRRQHGCTPSDLRARLSGPAT